MDRSFSPSSMSALCCALCHPLAAIVGAKVSPLRNFVFPLFFVPFAGSLSLSKSPLLFSIVQSNSHCSFYPIPILLWVPSVFCFAFLLSRLFFRPFSLFFVFPWSTLLLHPTDL